jgi:sialate O-acetylesterase
VQPKFLFAVLFAGVLLAGRAAEKPLVSPVFGDDMVLQRDQPDALWGWAEPGQKIRVEFAGHTAEATAGADGRWQTQVDPPSVGGPYTLKISSPKSSVELHGILVGDVWLCGGQSNMELGLPRAQDGAAEVAAANQPEIRFFKVVPRVAYAPVETLQGTWKICSPATAGENGGISAVAYYFARKLRSELNVPVGLVVDCYGGAPAECWMNPATLRPLKSFDRFLDDNERQRSDANGGTVDPFPNTFNYATKPAVFFNAMLRPLAPLALRGILWYQGEANFTRPAQYRTLLPLLIADWRAEFRQGELPFYIVSLPAFMPRRAAPGDDVWADLRDAQAFAARTVTNSGLAVTVDTGDAANIHPPEKKPVGERLALLALAGTYGKQIPSSGPLFASAENLSGALKIKFTHTDGGLVAKGGALREFAVAGADHQWHWADAKISGDAVVVSSPAVAAPVAARYAWQANPAATLFNGAGLPAAPFRTDDWPYAPVNLFPK